MDRAGGLFLEVDVDVFIVRTEVGRDRHEVHPLEVVEVHQAGLGLPDFDGVVFVRGRNGQFAADHFLLGLLVPGDADFADLELVAFFNGVSDAQLAAGLFVDARGDLGIGVTTGTIVVRDGGKVDLHVREGEGLAGFELEDGDQVGGLIEFVAGDGDGGHGVDRAFGDAVDQIDVFVIDTLRHDVGHLGIQITGVLIELLDRLDVLFDLGAVDPAFEVPEFNPVPVIALYDTLELAGGEGGRPFKNDVLDDAASAFVDGEHRPGKAGGGALGDGIIDRDVGIPFGFVNFDDGVFGLGEAGVIHRTPDFQFDFLLEAGGGEDGIAEELNVAKAGPGFDGDGEFDASGDFRGGELHIEQIAGVIKGAEILFLFFLGVDLAGLQAHVGQDAFAVHGGVAFEADFHGADDGTGRRSQGRTLGGGGRRKQAGKGLRMEHSRQRERAGQRGQGEEERTGRSRAAEEGGWVHREKVRPVGPAGTLDGVALWAKGCGETIFKPQKRNIGFNAAREDPPGNPRSPRDGRTTRSPNRQRRPEAYSTPRAVASLSQPLRSSLPLARTGICSTRTRRFGIHRDGTPRSSSV